jgi:hypothetical protein
VLELSFEQLSALVSGDVGLDRDGPGHWFDRDEIHADNQRLAWHIPGSYLHP